MNLFVFGFKLDTIYYHIHERREIKFELDVNLNQSINLVKGWGRFWN